MFSTLFYGLSPEELLLGNWLPSTETLSLRVKEEHWRRRWTLHKKSTASGLSMYAEKEATEQMELKKCAIASIVLSVN